MPKTRQFNLLRMARFGQRGKRRYDKKIHELEVILPEHRAGEDLEKALRKCPYKDEILNPDTGAHYDDSCMYSMTRVKVNPRSKKPHKVGDEIPCDDGSPCGTMFSVTKVTDYTLDNAIDIILGKWVEKRTNPAWISKRIREKHETLRRARYADPERYEAWMEEQLDNDRETLDAKDRYHLNGTRIDYASLDYIIRKCIIKAGRMIKPEEVQNASVPFYWNEERFYIERDVYRILKVTGEKEDTMIPTVNVRVDPDGSRHRIEGETSTKDHIFEKWSRFGNKLIPLEKRKKKEKGVLPFNWEENYNKAIARILTEDKALYEAWWQKRQAA